MDAGQTPVNTMIKVLLAAQVERGRSIFSHARRRSSGTKEQMPGRLATNTLVPGLGRLIFPGKTKEQTYMKQSKKSSRIFPRSLAHTPPLYHHHHHHPDPAGTPNLLAALHRSFGGEGTTPFFLPKRGVGTRQQLNRLLGKRAVSYKRTSRLLGRMKGFL